MLHENEQIKIKIKKHYVEIVVLHTSNNHFKVLS